MTMNGDYRFVQRFSIGAVVVCVGFFVLLWGLGVIP